MGIPDLVRAAEPIMNSLAEGHICRAVWPCSLPQVLTISCTYSRHRELKNETLTSGEKAFLGPQSMDSTPYPPSST